jgi:hypothetical protein
MERCEHLLKLVVKYDLYIDTVSILIPFGKNSFSLPEARTLNWGKIVPGETQAQDYYLLLRLQQPSRALIAYITRTAPDHIVTRVDISADFVTGNRDDADRLLGFQYRHLTQRRRRRGLRIRVIGRVISGRTIYLRKASAPRNLVMYARPSKFTGDPVAHLEWRFSRARTCKAIGVRKIGDLLNFDVAAAIYKTCQLSTFDMRKLERRLQACRHSAQVDRACAANLVKARLLKALPDKYETSEWNDLPVQECLDHFTLFQNCAVHVPISALIKMPLHPDWTLTD